MSARVGRSIANAPAAGAGAGSPPQDAFAVAAARLAALRPVRDARLRKIAASVQSNQLALARLDLAAHLEQRPADADALALLAHVAVQQGRRDEAIGLFERCLAAAPAFAFARYQLAGLLFAANRHDAARREVEHLLAQDGDNPLFLLLKANLLTTLGDGEEALRLSEQLVARHPRRVESWLHCGHARRAAGRPEACIEAYRRAIALRPAFGAAWWSLANLKTFRFDDADLATMRDLLARRDISLDDRVPLQFAFARALENRGDHEQAFEQYAAANAILRPRVAYDPRTLSNGLERNRALFTRAFFEADAGTGAPAADPIFVLGRPRSGTTLVEQILASHPDVEGAGELPYVGALAAGLHRGGSGEPAYGTDVLEAVAALSPSQATAMGEAYLRSAQPHRRLGRPRFIDKKPANFAHWALIHRMLPNAKIVDVRRHPAACCWSMFTTYSSKARLSLPELGRFHVDYVAMMAHVDAVLPGRVHRIDYEALVADPEAEIRRLLAYLDLPFDERCLRFHETARTVLTPSSEQVRRPLTPEAVSHWRHFEPWLGPLFESLAPAPARDPSV